MEQTEGTWTQKSVTGMSLYTQVKEKGTCHCEYLHKGWQMGQWLRGVPVGHADGQSPLVKQLLKLRHVQPVPLREHGHPVQTARLGMTFRVLTHRRFAVIRCQRTVNTVRKLLAHTFASGIVICQLAIVMKVKRDECRPNTRKGDTLIILQYAGS
ncbi:hypothetical protein BaRGS_00032767 [Batillaria attramentaria]|uniref:Uncharacterized protein n=1 Tax=Batillaria attramentaria TaxID=370345 RepID=A0ABD0JLW8_9CAEN